MSNEFRYRAYMVALDLAELDTVFAGRLFWSTRRLALARFRRSDYLGDSSVPLDEAVRQEVLKQTGRRPSGRIVLVTNLRCFGYLQNPVSFYYCHDRDGRVEFIVAEITNTPWSERHRYVLPVAPDAAPGTYRFQFEKGFHVSPFMPMDHRYDWRFTDAAQRVTIHMDNLKGGEKIFDATFQAERREISGRTLAAALLRHPCMTAKVSLGIYFQAFKLWCKRSPFYVHPKKREDATSHAEARGKKTS